MEKKKITGNIIGIIIITIIAGLYAFVQRGYLFDSSPQDLYDMLAEEGEPVKGEYVTVQVDASLGCYAETEHKINGIIPMGTDGHYLVWLNNDGIISLTVKGKDNLKILDDITNDTYNAVMSGSYIFPEPVEFTGKIETMNSELNGF
ncbi:MAG: hypothetical protein IJX12_02330, partial [Lachnospiraceae bacterium]|nr:hypothetical protein [Lachnospiraceae bacterium]